MDYKEFEDKVMENLRENLGNGYGVERGNGRIPGRAEGHSLLIGKQGVNVSMIVRMDEYDRDNAFTEEDTATAAGRIEAACRENAPDRDIDVSVFADWDAIKPHIYAKLVNTERNREKLVGIPHREYLDFSLVYYARMTKIFPGSHAGIQVWEEHMRHWGVDEDTLYQTAMENIQDKDEAVFESLEGLLQPLFSAAGLKLGVEYPMFVLGNRYRVNGAVQICNRDVMERIAGFFKGDFWILPSSIHEVLLLPAGQYGEDAEGLAGIVKEVNDSQLAPEEILSYHVYRYIRLTGETMIAV